MLNESLRARQVNWELAYRCWCIFTLNLTYFDFQLGCLLLWLSRPQEALHGMVEVHKYTVCGNNNKLQNWHFNEIICHSSAKPYWWNKVCSSGRHALVVVSWNYKIVCCWACKLLKHCPGYISLHSLGKTMGICLPFPLTPSSPSYACTCALLAFRFWLENKCCKNELESCSYMSVLLRSHWERKRNCT